MKFSIAAEAEQELIEGARFYATQASAELGHAFISEFAFWPWRINAASRSMGVVARSSHQDCSARRSCAAHSSTATLASSITRPIVMKPWIWRSKLTSAARLPACVRLCA